ncbi:helix-turn-helix domain-containing protein [Serratia proteamaculans]|uniref:helix-turn-helix domain-containing protein n=1 Tax=Serratia proteamaculans TaxID=28151 RepID=UPI0029810887|nr:helix-turn-helix transcriptional regulator [Serratia proteamaculans]MDW5510473.1 helix-turn-helix transcriptional regulator [Serratia proteamaculans]
MTLKRGGKLTEKERRVLSLLALSMSEMEIASYLGVSNKTVSIFKTVAMKKIGIRKNAHLIKWLRTPEARAAIVDGQPL